MASGIIIALIPGLFGFMFTFQINNTVLGSNFTQEQYNAHIGALSLDTPQESMINVTSVGEVETLAQLHQYIEHIQETSFIYSVSSLHPLYFFPYILLISIIGAILGTFSGPPVD